MSLLLTTAVVGLAGLVGYAVITAARKKFGPVLVNGVLVAFNLVAAFSATMRGSTGVAVVHVAAAGVATFDALQWGRGRGRDE